MKTTWKRILVICMVISLSSGQFLQADTSGLSPATFIGEGIENFALDQEIRPQAVQAGFIPANKSTAIDGARPDQNLYRNHTMIVKYAKNTKYRRDALLNFEIPQDNYDDVTKVSLRVYLTKADIKAGLSAKDVNLHFWGFVEDWDEKGVTWDQQPNYENLEEIGFAHAGKDQWTEIDVTNYFIKYGREQNLSFWLQGDQVTEAYMNVAGRLHANGPQLVITRSGSQANPPQTTDPLPDVDVDGVNRMITMEENDTMLKTLYINQKDPAKNRSKTDTLLVGQEYSAYLYTDTTSVATPQSAFLRFYVQEDYLAEPVPLEIWGVKNPQAVGPATTYQQQPELDQQMIYELHVSNRGWYSIDVTDYANRHRPYGFYLKAKLDTNPIVKIASYNHENTPVLYTAEQEDEFDRLRQKFAIKKESYDLGDPQILAMIKRNDDRVEGYLTNLNTDPNPSCVFWNYPLSLDKNGKAVGPAQATNNMRNSYVWLSTMLRAYHTYGSQYENDPTLYQVIQDGLKLLYDKSYHPYAHENGNWWQWEIGVPKVLGEMIITMYEDLAPQIRMDYLHAIYRFQPNPELSYYNRNSDNPKERLPQQESLGANRVDTCIGDLYLGIAAKNPKLIDQSVKALDDVYQYVEKGDGFYRDGSFIQHKNIAYTTAYGMVLVNGLTGIDSKLRQSRWQITDPDFQNIYAWVENSFIPMVFDGQAFPIVAGRSLSRQFKDTEMGITIQDGYNIARMLYAVAQNAPADKKEKWLALARRFMEKNKAYDVKANASNIAMLMEWQDLQNQPMADAYIGSKVFANMDRIVHHRPDYALALAMYSSRIQNFEMMNGENLRGWNQGNGALYLLNGDSGHYDNGFWPTVDPYRLAGTTVDVVARSSKDHKEEFTMDSDFVGGTSLDNQYSVGVMALGQPKYTKNTSYHTSLVAKKSWFFLDDEIIALGSGINASDDRPVETIVENRMIRPDGQNQVLINGQRVLETIGQTKEEFSDVVWAYLEANQDAKEGIGYFFPQASNLSAIKQKQTGMWKEINAKGTTNPISRNYVQFWLDHGKNPVNQTYSYAILPSKTIAELEAYAQAPDYEVLKNTDQVQAIYEKKLGILAANVFDPAGGDLGRVQVDQPVSLILKQKDGQISLAIADPTMKLKETIKLTLALDKKVGVIDHSRHIKVINTQPLELEISLAGAKGESASLHADYEKDTKPLEEPKDKGWGSFSPHQPQAQANSHPVINIGQEKSPLAKEQVKEDLFTDIANSWACQEINDLGHLGLIKGYPDGSFKPNALITRLETAQILANMLAYLRGEHKDEPKIEAGKPWYYRSVERIKNQGLMTGDIDGNLHLDDNIRRQDMFTVLGRLGQWKLEDEAESEEILSIFSDKEEVSAYAKTYMAQMVKMGLIKGNNGQVQAKKEVTRAELAVMVYRALKILHK